MFQPRPIIALIFLAIFAAAIVVAAPAPPTWCVAVSGSDSNAGTAGKPFASLQRALDESRKSSGDRRIVLQPGAYYLADTIALGPQDSGLIISGDKSRSVVVSGGRRITGFKPWRGKVLQADLSQMSMPDLNLRELYYNGKLMQWARYPNFDPAHPRTGGFLQNAGVPEAETKTKFMYKEGDLHPEKWSHPERAWMMFHDSLSYETQYCPIKSIDTEKRILEAASGVYVLKPGNPYYVCGILEELDAPGEWYVDPETKTLYFYPPSGDPNAADQVSVPALKSAFVLKGDPTQDKWVQNVEISGLAIRDTRGRAVEMTGAKTCAVVACDLRNCEVAVYLGDDTHGCRVGGCDITQTQGDGVSILGTSKDHERVTDNVVDNCYVYDIGWGRIHNRSGGVYGHRMARTKITRNHIHDTPRYAIGMDVGGDCEIAYNYCHHSNLVTLDTSIIEAATALDWGLPMEEQMERNRKYNWNNSIHHNILHDSGGWGPNSLGKLETPLYSWGIYLDTHSSGWRVHDNVIWNTLLGAYMVNGGMENVFENNICLDGKQFQAYLSVWTKYQTTGNRVERNIFAYQGKSAVLYNVRNPAKEAYSFSHNLAWANGEPVIINGLSGVKRKETWDAWLKLGQDDGAVIADPQFVDPAKRNYALKPTSPALKLGFKPIDTSKTGNYASPERRTWPRPEVKVVRDATDYTPAETSSAKQRALRTYEDYAVGEPERNANVGNKDGGTALVTDETAAAGKHSLKFTDAVGLPASFFPYLTYPLEQETGSLKMTFDLRWEKGALMALDWRDDPHKFNMGPNLTTSATGTLSANGKPMVQLPEGKWVHIEINCVLGDTAKGKYDLAVTLPDAQPQVFKDVDCSPQFQTLNCVVFMSVADAPAVFYIDNLAFVPSGVK